MRAKGILFAFLRVFLVQSSINFTVPEESDWCTVIMIEAIQTDDAPKAIGPYSQAIKANGMIFASGQIPLDPQTMQIVEGGIQAQTRQVLINLRAVLEAAGSSLRQVVKTTVYLADMADFAAMNEIYSEFFDPAKPARATVQAARLPRDARVEIDCIAII